VRLRIEEDFGMHHAISMRPLEISERKIVEILLGPQHAGAGIINVEKVLKAGKAIGGTHLFNRGEGNVDPIATCKGEHLLGFEAALDMKMQLGLGEALDESV